MYTEKVTKSAATGQDGSHSLPWISPWDFPQTNQSFPERTWQYIQKYTKIGLPTPLQPTQPPFTNPDFFFCFFLTNLNAGKSISQNLYIKTAQNHRFHMLSTEICHSQNESLGFWHFPNFPEVLSDFPEISLIFKENPFPWYFRKHGTLEYTLQLGLHS